MIYLIFAVILMGMVHPGGKWLMQQGVELVPFCMGYLLVRVLVQLPAVVFKPSVYKVRGRKNILSLTLFGLVGVSLHILEFAGLSQGLAVAEVTFLLYSYPLFIPVISFYLNKEPIKGQVFVYAVIALAGVSLLMGQGLKLNQNLVIYFYPLSASVFMALWICLSQRFRQQGFSSRILSFYFDLFTLLGLIVFSIVLRGAEDILLLLKAVENKKIALGLIAYGVFVGIVPNLLFYKACRIVSATKASMMLLFEPLLASLFAAMIWPEPLTLGLALGAGLIAIANVLNAWPKRSELLA